MSIYRVFAMALALTALQLIPARLFAEELDLAAMDGWEIVIPGDAIPSERYAAEEFQRWFEAAGGAHLEIVGTADPSRRQVKIGADGSDAAAMGPEDFRILVRSDGITIVGGRPRGTLYGVYTFLEDCLGVRFLTADHTHVPPIGRRHIVPAVDRVYRPPLRVRWDDIAENEKDPAFAARLRCNAFRPINNPSPDRGGKLDPKLGGVTNWVLINHSFARQVPSTRYGKDHPEYFCLVEGRRRAPVQDDAYQTQPCTTNPEVRRIVRQALLEEIAAQPGRENFSISQNDNELYCRCPRCAALDEAQGSHMGSLLTFVNTIAADVSREHPNVKIGTLAYQYSRKPPASLRPHPNVQIQLATIECSLIQPINDPASALNRAFCADFEAWSRISNEIYIWTYNTNFSNYLLPLPNLRILDDNIRFFVAHGVKGIYLEDAHAPVSGLADLRNYVAGRLLWDPSQDGDKLIDEFITLHYGPAAEPIRQYVKSLHDHAEANRIERNCFGRAADYGIDAAMMQRGLDAVEQALALAGQDEQVRSRVEKFSIAAYAAALSDAWDWIATNRQRLGQERMEAKLAADARPLASRAFDLCDRFGATEWRSVVSIDEARTLFKRAMGLSDSEKL